MIVKPAAIGLCAVLAMAASAGLSQSETEHNGLAQLPASVQAEVYQVVLDVEDPCFEFLGGDWSLVNSGNRVAYYYFTHPGPGSGEARGRWIAEGLPPGEYLVEFFCDDADYPTDARYEVIHASGVTMQTVNMNYVGAGWHRLGVFTFNRVGVVTVSDYWEGTGSLIAVDALRLTLQGALPEAPPGAVPPHIGICIDDVGNADPADPSTPLARMLRLPLQMTYAILPTTAYAAVSAEAIHSQGSEVILHQAMAAITIPNPGYNAITDSMTLEQVRATLGANLDSIPHVAGMNNHTGSLITQQRDKMSACMDVLKERGLFFFDSRTITKSVAFDVARENGLLTGERDLFIDGSNAEEAKTLIRSLAQRARFAPHVPLLAIGHVRSGTAQALEEMVPELAAMGVEIWPISRCLSLTVESDFQPAGSQFQKTGAWSAVEDRWSKSLRRGGAWATDASGAEVFFIPELPVAGSYRVWATWGGTEVSNAPALSAAVRWAQGTTTFFIDQREHVNDWYPLGRYNFKAGTQGLVSFMNDGGGGAGSLARADAVRFEFAGSESAFSLWALK
ncbi:MAG: hypothetical protein Kow0059_10590 [Candidatus Sumerlaeia bacterium]